MQAETEQRPAYVYCRYSSEMQSQGDSLRRQFQRCNEAIKRHNLYVKEQITDEAFSGYHGDNLVNGKLKSFLDRALAGEIEPNAFLIVENIDRITRLQPSKAVEILSSILRSGLEIYQTSPECLFSFKNKKDEAMTLIMMTLFSQRAHEESDTKSYRIKEAWLSRIQRIMDGEQKIVMNKAPYWLDIVEKEFDVKGKKKLLKCYEVNKERSEEVLNILDLLKSMGIKEVCKQVNSTSAKKWTVKAIQRLLASSTLFGEIDLKLSVRDDGKKLIQSRGITFPQIYPAIISEHEFNEVLAAIKDRGMGRGAGRKSTMNHNIFSKIIFCAHCKGAYRYMHKKNYAKSGNYSYLVCYNSEVHTCVHDSVLSVRYQEVEDAFFKYAQHYDLEKIFGEKKVIDYSKDISIKAHELETKQESFNTMLLSIMEKSNGVISPLYQKSLDTIESQIKELEKQLETLKQKEALKPKVDKNAEIYDFLKNKDDLLEDPINRAKMNAHLRRIIERIDLYNSKVHNDGTHFLCVKFKDLDFKHYIYFLDGKVYHAKHDDLSEIFDFESVGMMNDAQILEALDMYELESRGVQFYD